MGEFIAIAVIVLIIGLAVFYVVKAKKSGKKCIGCPDACNCKHKNGKDDKCSCSSNKK